MSATVLYMSVSLDGFIAGPNETFDNGLGDGGHRLHEWYFAAKGAGVNGQVVGETMTTGAIVAGRGTFEPAGGWGGDHHDGVPIFILSRHEPAAEFAQMMPVASVDRAARRIARPPANTPQRVSPRRAIST